MKLQKGKFLIKDINELDNLSVNKLGIKRVIDLAYMGQVEYEGNAIPISRMFIEYYNNDYVFYPIDIFNINGEQMYIYVNSRVVNEKNKINSNFMNDLARYNIKKNFSLRDYINNDSSNCLYDFWWDIEGDYFIFFGIDKIQIINYFINTCYSRDGGKEEIKKKLMKVGYEL